LAGRRREGRAAALAAPAATVAGSRQVRDPIGRSICGEASSRRACSVSIAT
jgi:hypothetical protein